MSAAAPDTGGRPPALPRARLADVVRGRAPLVGARFDPVRPRGLVSPIEARARLGLLYGDPAHEEARALEAIDAVPASDRSDLGLVARTALSWLLWPEPRGRRVARPYLVSAHVDDLDVTAALAALFAPPSGPRARMVHFVHAHALDLAAADPGYRVLLADADLVLPDGVGLRLVAALLGVALRDNLNGTDLLPLLCRAAAARGIPIALVGAAPGVAEACAERLRAATPGLSVALVSHGYLDDAGAAALAARIRALGRALVLVGMGSPRQERWAWDHLAPLREATVITVGGLFDFNAGRIPRAPQALRDLGLEWAYRLAQEPRRLARRYLVGSPRFVLRAVAQRCFGPEAAA